MNIYEEQALLEFKELKKVDDEFHRPRFEQLLKFIDMVKPETLIDIGCSWGYIMELVPKRIKTRGIDISPTKVAYCRGRQLDVIHLDIMTDRFPGKIYDLGVAMELLEHFENPLDIAEKCLRFSKHTVFSTPVYDNEEEAVDFKFHLKHIMPAEHLAMVQQIGRVKEFLVVKAPQLGYAWSMSLVERCDL